MLYHESSHFYMMSITNVIVILYHMKMTTFLDGSLTFYRDTAITTTNFALFYSLGWQQMHFCIKEQKTHSPAYKHWELSTQSQVRPVKRHPWRSESGATGGGPDWCARWKPCPCCDLLPVHLRESLFFPFQKDIPSGCILVSRQLSLISDALSLTFTTTLPLPKKASTSPEWHLSPEWDILYQHHRVWTGTNIYSGPREMLRKQSQQKRNNLLLETLLFLFLTSRTLKICKEHENNFLIFYIWWWKTWNLALPLFAY